MITYVAGKGMLVVLDGFSVMLPLTMSVGAMSNHLRELRALYDSQTTV